MNSFDLPSGPTRERARAIFAEIEASGALLRPASPSTGKRRLSASALYAAAAEDSALTADVSESRATRRVYHQFVADAARFSFPEARAASSGGAPARRGDGCQIHIERSRAEPDQFFVVVELLRDAIAGVMPKSLVVCDDEDRCQLFPLPTIRDGIAQLIADADSDLMHLISDPTTRIYVR